MSGSDRNRAALQAQLLNQGFGQAQGLAQQNYLNQLNLGQQSQSFLGQDITSTTTATINCSAAIWFWYCKFNIWISRFNNDANFSFTNSSSNSNRFRFNVSSQVINYE
jgi:hypothetical protein